MNRAVGLLLAVALLGGCTSLKRFAYEGFSRDRWQQSDRVMAALGIRPGDRVADLGAGSGYFTLRLARTVGPTGRVYAVDVDEAMNDYLRQRVAQAGLSNVDVILGRYEDPLLPDGEVDLVLSVDTYHHLEDRPAYFRNLRRDLAPGGRVAVIDFDGRKGWFVRWTGHLTPRALLLREMAEAGYEVTQEFDFIDRQVFVIFRPAGGPPEPLSGARPWLPRQRFHDVRHAAASLLLAQGVNPRVVMEILGHSQISLTLNTYSHVAPSLQRDAAKLTDAVLSGSR